MLSEQPFGERDVAKTTVKDNEEYWENGTIGNDESTVGVVDENAAAAVDDSLELQMISIRLNKSLLADMKMLADVYGTSYQPLMREFLSRFVKGEKRRIYKDYLARCEAEKLEAEAEPDIDIGLDNRKSA